MYKAIKKINYIPQPRVDVPLTLVHPKEKKVTVAAIIVTFCEGSSYDKMFTSLSQKNEEGSQTLVYAGGEKTITGIMQGFNGKSKDILIKNLIKEIEQLEPDCVVFNWECCSFYSARKFLDKTVLFSFIKMMIDRGHMLMFSDFSLKALIAQWDVKILGPIPFKKVEEYSGNVVLKFDPQILKNCPSNQLQIVGTLSTKGMCNVQASGSTIGYTVDWKVAQKTKKYVLDLLTIASNVQGGNSSCMIGKDIGAAGHCLLTYPSGGKILTSMTHWIDLMDLDTSQKKILQTALLNQGEQMVQQIQYQMQNLQQKQKKVYIKKKAIEYVQKSTPSNNQVQKRKQTKQ